MSTKKQVTTGLPFEVPLFAENIISIEDRHFVEPLNPWQLKLGYLDYIKGIMYA
jgi:hypothetical protein